MSATVSFTDLLGAQPDDEVAAMHARLWWGSLPEEAVQGRWVGILLLPSKICWAATLEDIQGALANPDESLWSLINLATWVDEQKGRRRESLRPPDSIYFSAGLLGPKRPPRGTRGTARDVAWCPGHWSDWDLDGKRFRDWSHIVSTLDELDRLGVGPQLLIKSGGGGLHAYWRREGGIAGSEVERWNRALRLLIEEIAGVSLDHVEEPSRVLRLPGSVRWGKHGEEPVGVEMLRGPEHEGQFVDMDRLREVTADVRERWETTTRETRQEARTRWREAREAVLDMSLATGWGGRWTIAMAEDAFNAAVTWADILVDAGWTVVCGADGLPRADREGRITWTRPHAAGEVVSERSLVVGWVGSPDVASLTSLSPATGLLALHEAGVPLSKARVAAELWFAGDLAALYRNWLPSRAAGLTFEGAVDV